MLSEDELLEWYNQNSLSQETRKLINTIRNSPPQRRVEGRRGNVTIQYPSKKMGQSIQAESHKNEMARIREFERNPEILEYYDQPITFKLTYLAKSGKRCGHRHTPDFFILQTGSAGFV